MIRLRFVDQKRGRHPGFTLAELLVAIAIIGMLATMALGAFYVTREQARATRTRATIAKINRLLLERYENYLARRAPITTAGLPPRVAAERRLNAIRDLIRMEMPQCFSEITQGPLVFTSPFPPPNGSQYSIPQPAIHRVYQQRLAQSNATPDHQSAECLYMILTVGPQSARDQFADYEIADTDQDGLPEFVDGWGRPIRFLRWAPGIVDSDIQPRVVDANGAFDPIAAVEAVKNDYDPFDSRKVDYSVDTAGPNFPPRSWRLMPFVYSAGADGVYDIYDIEHVASQAGPNAPELTWIGNPYYFWDGKQRVVNTLGKSTGSGFADNIHNHRVAQ
ncbi:MAG: type II secretion system GspH family protein [Thermoguttaceae bacterium]|nr:type II secretion system GspH family protein [Thermoguttaceae bacterium]MDW8079397.1 type II secretion system protein [Thermoguttaceae bacterium]